VKLRNKRTGEIIDVKDALTDSDDYPNHYVINDDWKDYEEPKEYWAIDCFSPDGELVSQFGRCSERIIENRKQIGNYFETREEAEKEVEKLKIYNKLKQKGFVFSGWYYSTEGQLVILADNHEFSETEPEDLTELFGDKIC